MKKFFIFLLLSFMAVSYAQTSTNRFDEEPELSSNSYVEENSNDQPAAGGTAQRGPGAPGEPVPIDDYIPLLTVTAVGIILYTSRNKRNLIS